MGCIKLHILDEQYKSTELKVSYINKKLTSKNSAVNPRRWMLVRLIDPTGMEIEEPSGGKSPIISAEQLKSLNKIYAKNFWGNVKLIGFDGKSEGKSYLVAGNVKKAVKAATKAGNNYAGDLSESQNVMHIPTGNLMDGVISSVTDTENSQRENGGHANIGDANVTRWDEGPVARAYEEDGLLKVEASITMFQVNGRNRYPRDASNLLFWWHVHPNTSVNGVPLGSSTPSGDFEGGDIYNQGRLIRRGFRGNTFVIGARDKMVTFFNGNKSLITIKYSDFKMMGGRR